MTESKRATVLRLLQEGSAFVHLDARHPNVAVPLKFKDDGRLCLHFGYDMPVPIKDLDVGEEFLSGTLSFGRQLFKCFIPWEAVWAVSDGDEMGYACTWPASVPSDVHGGLDWLEQPERKAPSDDPPQRGHLRLVKSNGEKQ